MHASPSRFTASMPSGRDPFSWYAAPLIIFAAVFMVLFAGVHEPEAPRVKWLGAGDAWTYAGPVLHYLDHRIHHGELPLWNPLINCGQPFAANPQSFMFYPPNLIRSLLSFQPTPYKTHVGVAILVLLHLWWGGLGAFVLARRHQLVQGAALVAAFAYVLSAGSLTRAVGHWYFHFALAWAPWLICCAHAALNCTDPAGRRRRVAGCGLIYGMILLAGTPHFMVLSGYLLAWYWVIWRVSSFFAGSTRDWGGLTRTLALDGVRLAAIAGIGILAASPLLLPAYEFSSRSGRSASSVQVEVFGQGESEWSVWQSLVVYSGDTAYEGLRASGALALILVIAALAASRRRDLAVYASFFFVALDCSLNEPWLSGRIFQWISPYPVSGPPRGMLLACLPLGMLAALGLDTLLAHDTDRRRRVAVSAIAIAAACVILGTLGYTAVPHPFLNVGWEVVLLPAVGISLAILLRWAPAPFMGGIAVAMLLFGELLFWNRAMLPFWLSESVVFGQNPAILHGERALWQGNFRGTDKRPNEMLRELQPAINGYDPLYLHDVAKILSLGESPYGFRRAVLFDEPTAESFHGQLSLKRQFWLANQYVAGRLPGPTELYPPTTTVFLDNALAVPLNRIDRKALESRAVSAEAQYTPMMGEEQPHLVIAFEGGEGPVPAVTVAPFKSPGHHAALALLVESDVNATLEPVFADPSTGNQELGKTLPVIPTQQGQAIYYEIPLPDFVHMELAIRPDFKEAAGRITVREMNLLEDMADENHRITVLERRANSVRVRLDNLPGPRILLNVDAWYPGWRVYLDGQPAPLLKANEAFKGVYVPAGTHEVYFVFRSWPVYAGIALSLITFAGVGAYLGGPMLRRRTHPAKAM